MTVDADALLAAPKVSLHDHLDGGLRPQTVLDLAGDVGHELPASTPAELRRWFFEAASSGSLERYLDTFAHTIAVMQTREALVRVAREYVADLAADGVVYGETRWAPEQHLEAGLTPAEAVEAVRDGLYEGMQACRSRDQEIVVQQLVTSMRHASPSREIAELAIRYRHQGVAGFDIAGAEAGYPPTRYLEAFDYLKRNNAYFTIHAGEAFGLPSIWERCRSAAPTGWATASASSTTSTSGKTARRPWGTWRRTSATPGCRWRCAPRPTCRPARRRRWSGTRSGCWPSFGSG